MRAQQAPGAAKVRYSVSVLDEQVPFIVLQVGGSDEEETRGNRNINLSTYQLMLQTVGGAWTLDIEAGCLPITCYM
jgi:hypothetical protein